MERLTKAGIYLLAVFVANASAEPNGRPPGSGTGQSLPGLSRKYNRYPQRLDDLVPEFIPTVPIAKDTLGGGGSFFYSSRPGGGEPMLYYEVLPPFGRRFYHLETDELGISGLGRNPFGFRFDPASKMSIARQYRRI